MNGSGHAKQKIRISLLQPPYPDPEKSTGSADTYAYILNTLDDFKEETDLIVLPEYAGCPGVEGRTDIIEFCRGISGGFADTIKKFAAEKKINIAFNYTETDGGKLKNVTMLVDRKGIIAGRYEKVHLTDYEKHELQIEQGNNVQLFLLEGVRIAFITCMDIYFPEYIVRIASLEPDIIIFPSYQRFERSETIRTLTKSRAFDAAAYIARASYSLGQDSKKAGCSMVVDPLGNILIDVANEIGIFTCDLEIPAVRPVNKEYARRPEMYRPAGPMIKASNQQQGYPRAIAHRGASICCPENTLQSFAVAVASGADEIEFDIRLSRDGQLVVSHDPTVERITGYGGRICDMNWAEIVELEVGTNGPGKWPDVHFCRLDDILHRFAASVVMNIHIKDDDDDSMAATYRKVGKVIDKLKEYNCAEYAYIAGNKNILAAAQDIDATVERCCLERQDHSELVDCAIKYKCGKLQFYKPYYSRELIIKAHDHGIKCNMFWSDDPGEARHFLEEGIDSILTNNILQIGPVVREYQNQMRNDHTGVFYELEK